jgi:hypothetical protein
MTFGMFQWTIGAGEAAGELPALLKKIKQASPAAFQQYFGRHGLDVSEKTSDTHGYLVLNGNTLRKKSEKENLRDIIWSFYFWKSAQDPLVQAVQIQHALSRLDAFYRSPSYRVAGHDIADIITSEYGIGLILDHHVNRPGYIKSCLHKALQQAGLENSNPKHWSSREENQVIEHYLQIRAGHGRSPMTDAVKRAGVTRKYLDRGLISAERGSFKYGR